MKRVFLILLMLVLASTAFAQVKISLTGRASTDMSSVWPVIGVEIGFNKLDIFTDFALGIGKTRNGVGNPGQSSTTNWAFGIGIGVAPKIGITDKMTLSFPFSIGLVPNGTNTRFKDSAYESGTRRTTRFSFGLDAGARICFGISPHWGIFTGFGVRLFSVTSRGRSVSFGGSSARGSTVTTNIFNSGSIDLGIKVTF